MKNNWNDAKVQNVYNNQRLKSSFKVQNFYSEKSYLHLNISIAIFNKKKFPIENKINHTIFYNIQSII